MEGVQQVTNACDQGVQDLEAISAVLSGDEEKLKAHKLEKKMIVLMCTVHAVEDQIAETTMRA